MCVCAFIEFDRVIVPEIDEIDNKRTDGHIKLNKRRTTTTKWNRTLKIVVLLVIEMGSHRHTSCWVLYYSLHLYRNANTFHAGERVLVSQVLFRTKTKNCDIACAFIDRNYYFIHFYWVEFEFEFESECDCAVSSSLSTYQFM